MWNLLVVEDESIVRIGLRYMVNWEDHGVVWKAEASNAEDALRILDAEDIHILMTDIRMPGMDGLEFAKRVKKRKPSVQIIILSSYDNFSYAKEAMCIGVANYLHKPTMDEEEILDTLRRVVDLLEESNVHVEVEALDEKDKNEQFLLLLDEYTFPENNCYGQLGLDFLDSGFWLTVFRRRIDANQTEDTDFMRFRSIQHLIDAYVSEDWGGIVFHRNHREMIWIAPSVAKSEKSRDLDRMKYLDTLRHKVRELLNVVLIYSASSKFDQLQELPEAYMEALLQFPLNEQSDHYIVRRSKEYLDKHLLMDITLVKVAEAMHVSPGYLSRIFLKDIGENFSDYVIRNKLELAQKLLRDTNRKIYEIAADIGYTNAHYFSKLFKERVGVKPMEYRNQ